LIGIAHGDGVTASIIRGRERIVCL
jgi:hypothetical protein